MGIRGNRDCACTVGADPARARHQLLADRLPAEMGGEPLGLTRRDEVALRAPLARDERLDHLTGAVGLRPRFGDPFVFAALEYVPFAIAAGGFVRRGEFLLHS